MARKAKATEKLLEQINAVAPKRSKKADGWIGDKAHQTTQSDHNPNRAGVVCAIDFTHDPANGFHSHDFAEMLRQRRDRRVKYVISRRKIFGGPSSPSYGKNPWVWQHYSGRNPHDIHVHISVADDPKLYDDASAWVIEGVGGASTDASSPVGDLPLLKRGAKGEAVRDLQRLLQLEPVDGAFGPNTEAAVKKFQREHDLDADGIVGPYTWRELLRPATEEDSPVQLPAPDPEKDKTWWEDFIDWLSPKPPASQPEGDLKPDEEPPSEFYSVVGGFFSSDPYDKKVPTSVRTNNPGALNTSPNVEILPGYLGWDDPVGKGNKTAIFRSPEHGVAAWWDLMWRYRVAGAKTVQQIITRYGGGQNYSAYVKFVTDRTGLAASHEIKLEGDDANLLKFAKAMFRYEAGMETVLSDQQILRGFEMGRARQAEKLVT